MKIETKHIGYKKLRQNDWFTSQEVDQYKHFGITKRDTSRCINNLIYYTLIEKSNNKTIVREFSLNNLKKGYFKLTRSFHRAVKCYTVWNNHFNYRIDQNDFIDAMEDLYYDRYCDSVALSDIAKKYERIKVRYIAKAEYNRFWKIGETAYRNEFKKEYPECFVPKGKAKYTCLDNHTIEILSQLTSTEKTMACNRKRSLDRKNVVVHFLNTMTYDNIDKYIVMRNDLVKNRRCEITSIFLEAVNKNLKAKGFRVYTAKSLRNTLPSIIRFCTNGILESLPDFVDAIKLTEYSFNEKPEENIAKIKDHCRINRLRKISIKLLGVDVLSGEKPKVDKLDMLYKDDGGKDDPVSFWYYPLLLTKICISTEDMMAIPTKKKMSGVKGVTYHLLSSKFHRDKSLYLKQFKTEIV